MGLSWSKGHKSNFNSFYTLLSLEVSKECPSALGWMTRWG